MFLSVFEHFLYSSLEPLLVHVAFLTIMKISYHFDKKNNISLNKVLSESLHVNFRKNGLTYKELNCRTYIVINLDLYTVYVYKKSALFVYS